jgi:hypothetical protein
MGEPVTISKSQKKIFPENKENKFLGFDRETLPMPELHVFLKCIVGCKNVNSENNKY